MASAGDPAISYVPGKPYIRISPTGLTEADVIYITQVLKIKPKANDPDARQGYYMKGADDGPRKLDIKRTSSGINVNNNVLPDESIQSYFEKYIFTPANKAKGERGARVVSMDELADMFQTGVAVEDPPTSIIDVGFKTSPRNVRSKNYAEHNKTKRSDEINKRRGLGGRRSRKQRKSRRQRKSRKSRRQRKSRK